MCEKQETKKNLKKLILRESLICIVMTVLNLLLCSPLFFMTVITSAFNDTGYHVSTILFEPQLLLIGFCPALVVQLLIGWLGIKKSLRTKVAKGVMLGLSSLILLIFYSVLSASYAPDSLIMAILGLFFN